MSFLDDLSPLIHICTPKKMKVNSKFTRFFGKKKKNYKNQSQVRYYYIPHIIHRMDKKMYKS